MSEHPEGPAVPAASPASATTPAPVDADAPTHVSASAPEDAQQPVKPVLTPSQAKRANQTLKGMIISVLLTVAVAIPVILINPPDKAENFRAPVDVADVASQAAADADFTPWAPNLPEGDYVNFARWITGNVDGIKFWEFGVVTKDDEFVWVRQTAGANPSWLAAVTENAALAGTHAVDGTDWELRTKGKSEILIGTLGKSTIVLTSDSGLGTLESLARLAQQEIPAK
ncbi:DUF4245 domain-containing protein [Paeniglutamicibacter sp. ABSL32-1]|uniref:DUF4245 domain-containing protein n=1 Tax=Paeniglutamicibacter quisquiliarum TaxID=2849498 RepID=UPI001C2D809B|nr:DUF4245 domain-containing protein [Paeniglutamicibacter quisquiliarum]